MIDPESFDAPTDEPSARKPRVRGRTTSMKRFAKRALFVESRIADVALIGLEGVRRPASRPECVQGENAERPCPFVSCKHHLYLDVSPKSGALKLNFPNLEVWEMAETCSLDVADNGGATLEEVGAYMNLTRERIRQLEVKGAAKLKELAAIAGYAETWIAALDAADARGEIDDVHGPRTGIARAARGRLGG